MRPSRSEQSYQVFAMTLEHLLIEAINCVFLEMKRLSMRFLGSIILILLEDHDRVRVALGLMWNVAHAARLPAGCLGQIAQNLGNFSPVFRGKLQTNKKALHLGRVLTGARSGTTVRTVYP